MWVDVEQNSEEWFDLRAGKVTGSSISKVMANYGKSFGIPARDLAATVAKEQLTGNRQDLNRYTNPHMERGHIEEPVARALYEDMYFVDVNNGGFYDNGTTGSSPDGRVGDNGLVEIKSAIIAVHYNRIRKGGFDATYKWQLIFNMHESGRDWIDFVSYCAGFPVETRLYVYRLKAVDFTREYEMIRLRLNDFQCLVNDIKGVVSK